MLGRWTHDLEHSSIKCEPGRALARKIAEKVLIGPPTDIPQDDTVFALTEWRRHIIDP